MGNTCHTQKTKKNQNPNINPSEKYNFKISLTNFRGKNFKKVT